MLGVQTIVKLLALETILQLRDFLAGTQPAAFLISGDKNDRYHWIQLELVRLRHLGLNRPDKGW